MRRISVVGSPGSGKSSVASVLAPRLGVDHVELDALYHQADWAPRPRDDFRAEIRGIVSGDGWVVDGNYGSRVQDLVWAAADTVVWLDLSKARVMSAVFNRTLRRILGRTVLWNENRERLANLLSRDPQRNLLLWTWTQYEEYRDTYARAAADPALAHLEFVRLRSRREIQEWLDKMDRAA